MSFGQIVDLNRKIALAASQVPVQHKLAMAVAVIYAAASIEREISLSLKSCPTSKGGEDGSVGARRGLTEYTLFIGCNYNGIDKSCCDYLVLFRGRFK